MQKFQNYDLWDNKPTETGAYVVLIISRDGITVPRVAFYDVNSNKWMERHIQEYGYAIEGELKDEFIQAFQKIEGIEYTLVPESHIVKFPDLDLDDTE